LITESLILTLLGGAAGVAVAAVSLPLLSSLVPRRCRSRASPHWDTRALALAGLFTALTGLGFGLFPRAFAPCGAPASPPCATAAAPAADASNAVRAGTRHRRSHDVGHPTHHVRPL
jgi:hypothetical protein